MKKVISVFLAALFVFSCINLSFIPVNAITDYTTGVTEDGFDYIIDNETGELTVTWVEDYSITDLVIPSYIDGHPVTAIGAHFLGDTQYENVYATESMLIYNFIKWLRKQDFYDNTTVMIVGDHISMQADYFESRGANKRYIYNCYIKKEKKAINISKRIYDLSM